MFNWHPFADPAGSKLISDESRNLTVNNGNRTEWRPNFIIRAGMTCKNRKTAWRPLFFSTQLSKEDKPFQTIAMHLFFLAGPLFPSLPHVRPLCFTQIEIQLPINTLTRKDCIAIVLICTFSHLISVPNHLNAASKIYRPGYRLPQ